MLIQYAAASFVIIIIHTRTAYKIYSLNMYDFLVKIFMMSEMRIYTKIVAIYAFYAAL